jgi:hypothetical protein
MIVAILLLGILATGLLLWLKLPRSRRPGKILLSLSILYCAVVLGMIRAG